jgi:hypothetical protein
MTLPEGFSRASVGILPRRLSGILRLSAAQAGISISINIETLSLVARALGRRQPARLINSATTLLNSYLLVGSSMTRLDEVHVSLFT